MSEAVVGLIGVIVGAALAGAFEYTIRHRAERRDARAAARLVLDAFSSASEALPWPRNDGNVDIDFPETYDFSLALEDGVSTAACLHDPSLTQNGLK